MPSDAQVDAAWVALVKRYQPPPDKDALRAALEAAEAAAWRPIEEADGKGDVLMVNAERGKYDVACQNSPFDIRIAFGWMWSFPPTHFRPLPEPPRSE